ncbi:hypothetical protein J6590_085531 [Homalodisca vitripennis]|nr:hypothetical protein J6590_085531 [Homalodisca vitripennis]
MKTPAPPCSIVYSIYFTSAFTILVCSVLEQNLHHLSNPFVLRVTHEINYSNISPANLKGYFFTRNASQIVGQGFEVT